MGGYYILEGKYPKRVDDVVEWAKQFEACDNRVIEQTKFDNDVMVSTVFLGLDHSYSFSDSNPKPILFETMIFGGDEDGYQERYATWDEAVEGHKAACKLIKEPQIPKA